MQPLPGDIVQPNMITLMTTKLTWKFNYDIMSSKKP